MVRPSLADGALNYKQRRNPYLFLARLFQKPKKEERENSVKRTPLSRELSYHPPSTPPPPSEE